MFGDEHKSGLISFFFFVIWNSELHISVNSCGKSRKFRVFDSVRQVEIKALNGSELLNWGHLSWKFNSRQRCITGVYSVLLCFTIVHCRQTISLQTVVFNSKILKLPPTMIFGSVLSSLLFQFSFFWRKLFLVSHAALTERCLFALSFSKFTGVLAGLTVHCDVFLRYLYRSWKKPLLLNFFRVATFEPF